MTEQPEDISLALDSQTADRETGAHASDAAPAAEVASTPDASAAPPPADENVAGEQSADDSSVAVEEAFAEDVAGDEPDDDADDDDDNDDDDDDDESEVVIHDADAEDAEELARWSGGAATAEANEEPRLVFPDEVAPGGGVRSMTELMAVVETLIFVSEDPLSAKTLGDVLDEDRGWVAMAIEELAKDFNERNGGLMLREVAGGWQFATRPEYHEQVRAFLKSRPSAKLSLAALETLAVIAYKQPITVPEILEIRGVQSSSAIKTLLDKRLIVAKGRKETVGRPMLYGTSKDFLLQFGLKDLADLPNVEDFEDLAGT